MIVYPSAVATGGQGAVPPLTVACASHFCLLKIMLLEDQVTARQQTMMVKQK